MTSVSELDLGHDFTGNAPSAAQKVNAGDLDSILTQIQTWANDLRSAIGQVVREDDTLADACTGLRHLKTEVRNAIAAASGWRVVDAVDAATTTNITLSGEQAIDGITTNLSRVLVKDQTNAEDNGIFRTGAGAWTRESDADSASDLAMAFCYVNGGNTQTGLYFLQTQTSITLGTTELAWVQAGGLSNLAEVPILTAGSTTPRSLEDRFADVLNVKDFGTVGDGAADDTAAFAAAITAAPAGAAIFVPPGTYAISGLTITKNLAVIGSGPATILKQTATNDNLIDGTGYAIEVRDLVIQGAFTSGSTYFAIACGALSRIQRVTFTGSTGSNGVDSGVLTADDTVVEDCAFRQGFTDAVRVVDVDRVRVGRCTFTATATFTWDAIDGDATAGNIDGLVVDTCVLLGAGVTLNAASTRTITGFTFSGNLVLSNGAVYPSITVAAVTANTIRGTISANVCDGYQALTVESVLTIAGNVLRNGRTNGITLGSGVIDCLITGNHIRDPSQVTSNTYHGVAGNPSTGRAILSGNYIQGSDMAYGVNVTTTSGATVEISGNYIASGLTGRILTTNGSRVGSEYVVKISVDHDYFDAAALTVDKNLLTLPGGHEVVGVTMKHSQSFAGGAISAYTVSLGISGNVTKYAAAFDAFQAVGATVFQHSTTRGVESFSNVNLVARATAVGANLDQATAGEIDIYVTLRDLGAA